jgi:TRAP-type transport system small permease protein
MEHGFQSLTRTVLRVVDRTTDTLALTGLAALVVVVSWQVFGRYVLQASPSWAPELALTLLAWLGFLGIAIGVREHTHIGVTFVTDRMPRRVQAGVLRLAPVVFLVFAVYLVIQGWAFTQQAMGTVLPSTGLPSAVRFAAMPVTGVLVGVYCLLHIVGVPTQRGALADPQPKEKTLPSTDKRGEAGDAE